MEVGFSVMHQGRGVVAQVGGVIVRIAHGGFGVEWCEFAQPAVLAMLLMPALNRADGRIARARTSS